MQTIHITVRNKFAVCTEPEAIVANNTDWCVKFDLDADWDGATTKYCRFYYNDFHLDKFFEGSTCNAPTYNEIEDEINDGPEPMFIGLGLFNIDVNAQSGQTDPISTNIVYLKCTPSIKETGELGAYAKDLKNLLFMTTDPREVSNYEGNPNWKTPWSPAPNATSREISQAMKEVNNHINIQNLNGNLHSIINSVTIEVNDREMKEISIPLNIYNGTDLDDMQWGKDYIFSYQLDYGYNCAFWWTYEINDQAMWKSKVQATMDFKERLPKSYADIIAKGNYIIDEYGNKILQETPTTASETVCLLPTNKEGNRNTKRLVLHLLGSFGDNFMQGAKVRFLNLRVREVEDTESYIPPQRIVESNYISTDSHYTALHRWGLGQHTQMCSSFISENEWVIVNPFMSVNETSYLTHWIYPSIGNSLFPQNEADSRNWQLSCKIFNTSQKENIYGCLVGVNNGQRYFLVTNLDGLTIPPKTEKIVEAKLNMVNPYKDGVKTPLPPKFDYIFFQLWGGNDGINTILIEDLQLIDLDNATNYPQEWVYNNKIAGGGYYTEQQGEQIFHPGAESATSYEVHPQ